MGIKELHDQWRIHRHLGRALKAMRQQHQIIQMTLHNIFLY